MCLLIFRRGRDGSMLLAANRDERYDRPTRGPFLWDRDPPVLAGHDEQAGGTWLALGAGGLVAAVTNRPTAGGMDPARPTRGSLPLLACACGSARRAREALSRHLEEVHYNGFNLLVADAEEAFVIEADGRSVGVRDVPPGLHLVGNGPWDDPADGRLARARSLLGGCGPDPAGLEAERLAELMEVCRDHGAGQAELGLCVHGPAAGTVSSTILLVGPDGRVVKYLHCEGPPCCGEYADLTATAGALVVGGGGRCYNSARCPGGSRPSPDPHPLPPSADGGSASSAPAC